MADLLLGCNNDNNENLRDCNSRCLCVCMCTCSSGEVAKFLLRIGLLFLGGGRGCIGLLAWKNGGGCISLPSSGVEEAR